MTNLSSLSKVQYANIASIILFIVALVLEMVLYGWSWVRLLNFFNFALAWFVFINIRKAQETIHEVAAVIKSAEMSLLLAGETSPRKLAPNTDFLPLLFSDSGKAEANLENGVLTLRIPKAEEARPKTIKINAK